GDRGPEGRREGRLRHPEGHDPDPDAARDHYGRVDDRAGLRQVAVDARGSADLGRQRLPAGREVRPGQEQEGVPDPARAVHDRQARWLGSGDDQVLRREQRHRHQGRTGPGGVHERVSSAVADTSSAAPPRPAAWPRLGGAALGRGLVVAYLSIIVLIPIAALVAQSTDGGWSAFWNAISNPEAWWALKWTLIPSLI